MPPHARPHHFAPGVDPGSLAIEPFALMDGLQAQWLLAPERIDMLYLQCRAGEDDRDVSPRAMHAKQIGAI
jgi:hypothetical protein